MPSCFIFSSYATAVVVVDAVSLGTDFADDGRDVDALATDLADTLGDDEEEDAGFLAPTTLAGTAVDRAAIATAPLYNNNK
jgi:hypothetical protein